MKKILLSINNFLLLSLSILIGLFLFLIMKNEQHNNYIIDLNKRAPIIASQIEKIIKSNQIQDYYYSIFSVNQNKILHSNLITNIENKIKFNYIVSFNKDLLTVSIYEKELDNNNLIKLMFYIIIVTYIAGYILLYIVEKKESLSKEVENLYFLDFLTQLHNKVKFTKYLDKKIKEKTAFYVVVTDIEDFKRINQLSGYEVGDLLLKNYAVSLKLKKLIKNPARISGNEFIFYINEKDLEGREIEEILRNMITEIYVIKGEAYKINQNIGYVKYPKNSLSVEELIKFAEIAMHQAKESKNSIQLYQDIILEKVNKNNMIKKELVNALDNNEFFLVYQPKVNLNNNKIYAEVLVRWKNEKLGFITPDVFIQIAEKTGEIDRLGKWIFEQAIKEIAKYNMLGQEINLSINVSPKQLMNHNIFEDFNKIIKDNNVNYNQITLELTESVILEKIQNFDLLIKFSQTGIKLSIDDFGKGYSSFSYLKDFPINEIKLDKNFIDEIEKPFNANLVESISNLSKKLNVSLVIEGVEKEEQITILKKLGCYFFQGYYFSKPLSSENFKEYIQKRVDM